MRPLLARSLCATALAGGVAGCFGDTAAPPAFRFDCASQSDCDEPEECIDGLCQVRCTYSTFETDCPGTEGYAACFNGLCAHLCDTAAKVPPCPGNQSCRTVPLDGIDLGGGGLGGSSIDLENLGVCGVACDADSCPDGELCVEGVCVPLDAGETDGTGDTGA
jgi:hypothetical protein